MTDGMMTGMTGMTTAVTADSLLLGTSLVDRTWEEEVTFVVSTALDICSLKKIRKILDKAINTPQSTPLSLGILRASCVITVYNFWVERGVELCG